MPVEYRNDNSVDNGWRSRNPLAAHKSHIPGEHETEKTLRTGFTRNLSEEVLATITQNISVSDGIVKVVSMVKFSDGTVIDSEELTSAQRMAYIELAIHLAAPKIAEVLLQRVQTNKDTNVQPSHPLNEVFFTYPPMMTVKQTAELLSVSESRVREMERRWSGKYFPAVRIGGTIGSQ